MDSLSPIDNPFRTSIVNNAWLPPETDVPEIHADVFQECCQIIEAVRRSHKSTSLLIHGEAGSGKTHLLGRLRSHVRDHCGECPVYDKPVFVWIRLQSSPGMIWRYTRRRFAEDLFRCSNGGRSQFEVLLLNRFAGLRVADGDLELWWQWFHQEVPEDFEDLMERMGDACNLERNVFTVMKHLALGRFRRDAQAWLRGDSLPEAALERLGLAPVELGDEDQEDLARDVILALCRLASPEVPVIFCFDQVEALQRHPQDMAGLFAFGQLVSSLHDDTDNVLIVSCVQSAFADLLKQKARGADYDRMREYGERSLAPILWEQARTLITSRLDANPSLASMRQQQRDALWPLDEVGLRDFVGPQGCTPRRVLSFCAERFASLAQRDPIRTSAEAPDFLNELFEQRFDQCLAKNSLDQSEQILAHGLPLLIALSNPEWRQIDENPLRDVPLVFEGRKGRVGISLCTQQNMTSLAAQLRRLREPLSQEWLTRLVLIRDSRSPISKTAAKTRQYLTELTELGVSVIHPSAEALAALDALRALLSDAKSGDLSLHGGTVAAATVEQWLATHLPHSLTTLADQLTETGPVNTGTDDSELFERMSAVLAERHVMPLAVAAEALEVSVERLERTARKYSDQTGVLAGPPAVLFQRVPATSET